MSENNIKASISAGESKVYIVPLDLEVQFFVYYSKKKYVIFLSMKSFLLMGGGILYFVEHTSLYRAGLKYLT